MTQVMRNGEQADQSEAQDDESHVHVQFMGDKNEIHEKYYDYAAMSGGRFGFLSPMKLPEWLRDAARWMCEADRVAEVGPGYGKLVEQCLSQCGEHIMYYAIDISQFMLKQTRFRVGTLPFTPKIEYLKKDITCDPIPEIPLHSLERVAAINVMQDVDAEAALKTIGTLLQPGGLLRATFIRRDTQDAFWAGDVNYDVSKGCFYNFSSWHEQADAPPLGYVLVENKRIPFYRVQTYFTHEDVLRHLASAGYELVAMNELNYPLAVVKERWSSGFARTELTERQRHLLDRWGCFPDAWDVIAQKLP